MNTYLSIYNIQFDSNENKYDNILSYLFYEYLTDKIINVQLVEWAIKMKLPVLPIIYYQTTHPMLMDTTLL